MIRIITRRRSRRAVSRRTVICVTLRSSGGSKLSLTLLVPASTL